MMGIERFKIGSNTKEMSQCQTKRRFGVFIL